MFDNLFTPSPSVWGMLVGGMIALPILIHLINLLRHKRVSWAAMEFLLKSHKKNRNWIWLKQFLLLLSRIALLLLALFLLAQVGCQNNQIARLLGGPTTHHYILVDDSFSMAEQQTDGSPFDHARATLSLIAQRAKHRQNQWVTLLRYSSSRPAGMGDQDGGTADQPSSLAPVLNAVQVDSQFAQTMENAKSQLEETDLAFGIGSVLSGVKQLIEQRKNENAIVYILSDFRNRDWENPEQERTLLKGIQDAGAAIELIQCVTTTSPNLAITALEPAGNVRVAQTPLMMQVTLKNLSDRVAEKVQVQLTSIPYPAVEGSASNTMGKPESLPALFIQKIGPGETAIRQFPVYFETPGQHVIVAELGDDPLAPDNRRWSVVTFQSEASVLILDSPAQHHSLPLALALNPNRMTGIRPHFKTRDFLRDATAEELDRFDVIYCLDLAALDESAVEQLEAYARRGGGVAFFMGPEVQIEAYNRMLYRDGQGILPMELGRPVEIPEQLEERVADIFPNDHPIFAPVLHVKNSLLRLVQVKSIIEPAAGWIAHPGTSKVLATVRGREEWPLVVEKQVGKGKSVLVTTTAGPVWNNWSRNATFPPIMLLLENDLAAGRYPIENHLVGFPITIDVAADRYQPRFQFGLQLSKLGDRESAEWSSPDPSDVSLATEDRLLRKPADRPERLTGMVGMLDPTTGQAETDLPGIYDLTLTTTESQKEVRRMAINVDTTESDLKITNRQKLLADLKEANPVLVDWNAFNPEPKQKPASSLGKLLLGLMVIMLLIEQLLAYSASYHQADRPARMGRSI